MWWGGGVQVGRLRVHARKIDAHCAGTAPNDVGPVLRRLREVGITGIAFGAFGEAPDDANLLLKAPSLGGNDRGSGTGMAMAGAGATRAQAVGARAAVANKALRAAALRCVGATWSRGVSYLPS